TGQHQRHRLEWIDQVREPRGAAEAGMQAEHDFWEAKAGIVDRDPILADQRDLKTAAKAETVNDGDRRHTETVDAVGHRMRAGHCGLDLLWISGAAELIDIGAGDESGRLRRADHQSAWTL